MRRIRYLGAAAAIAGLQGCTATAAAAATSPHVGVGGNGDGSGTGTDAPLVVDIGGDHRRVEERNLSPVYYKEYYNNEVRAWLTKSRFEIERTVFVSYDSEGNAYRSTAYLFDDFLEILQSMSVNGVGGGDDSVFFYIGQTDDKGIVHGLVNVAAFLAHAMAISIKHDVCDEFNVDATDFTQKYAVSNSCGQWGRSYQDEACVGDDASMTCDVNPDISITAADSLDGDKSPPPLECRPKEYESDFTGHWDAELGVLSETYPYANRAGVLHNEGCCWWGRGILFTRGTCNFGRLDHYLGRGAAAAGFLNFYDVDICAYPEIVCEGPDTRGLRWSVGYFEWADRVQIYKDASEGLDYMEDLNTFVETGFLDVNRFIDVVGRALPFGCVEENCRAFEEKVKQERRDNFLNMVFNVLNLPLLVETTPFPTPPPTNKPTEDTPPNMRDPPTKMPTSQPTPQPTPQPVDLPATPKPTPQPLDPPTANPTPQPQVTIIIGNVCSGQMSSYVALNGCRDYVQCLDGEVVFQETCSAGLLFDQSINACTFESDVFCDSPATNPAPEPTWETPKPTWQSTAPEPTPQPQDDFTYDNICSGQSSTYIPINGCRDYVQCVNGNVVLQQSCSAGLLFDSSINACNWATFVDVCDAPTQRPTPRPTQQTSRPSRRPVYVAGPTGSLPMVPQPPPTNPPSRKPIPIPVTTQPPFANQRPIGMSPNSQSDGQKEQTYEPTHSLQPSQDRMGLINLPSGASNCSRSCFGFMLSAWIVPFAVLARVHVL